MYCAILVISITIKNTVMKKLKSCWNVEKVTDNEIELVKNQRTLIAISIFINKIGNKLWSKIDARQKHKGKNLFPIARQKGNFGKPCKETRWDQEIPIYDIPFLVKIGIFSPSQNFLTRNQKISSYFVISHLHLLLFQLGFSLPIWRGKMWHKYWTAKKYFLSY
jgi:hypothetical protein